MKTNQNIQRLNFETFFRSNQDTCLSQRPLVKQGQWIGKGQLLADCINSVSGDLALGKNVLVAYMPWEGYNFEDSIVISDRLIAEDIYTSIHILRFRTEIVDNLSTKSSNVLYNKNLSNKTKTFDSVLSKIPTIVTPLLFHKDINFLSLHVTYPLPLPKATTTARTQRIIDGFETEGGRTPSLCVPSLLQRSTIEGFHPVRGGTGDALEYSLSLPVGPSSILSSLSHRIASPKANEGIPFGSQRGKERRNASSPASLAGQRTKANENDGVKNKGGKLKGEKQIKLNKGYASSLSRKGTQGDEENYQMHRTAQLRNTKPFFTNSKLKTTLTFTPASSGESLFPLLNLFHINLYAPLAFQNGVYIFNTRILTKKLSHITLSRKCKIQGFHPLDDSLLSYQRLTENVLPVITIAVPVPPSFWDSETKTGSELSFTPSLLVPLPSFAVTKGDGDGTEGYGHGSIPCIRSKDSKAETGDTRTSFGYTEGARKEESKQEVEKGVNKGVHDGDRTDPIGESRETLDHGRRNQKTNNSLTFFPCVHTVPKVNDFQRNPSITSSITFGNTFSSFSPLSSEMKAPEGPKIITTEKRTPKVPFLVDHLLTHLDDNGVAKVGTWVSPGDILVGKVRPLANKLKSSRASTQLAWEIISSKKNESMNMEDRSFRLPKGVYGRVIKSEIISHSSGEHIHVYLAIKRKIQIGDKLAGRHGNKGIVSLVLPRQDMPYLADGTPIDIILSPLGVPSRMNVGQIYECLLGLAAKSLACDFTVNNLGVSSSYSGQILQDTDSPSLPLLYPSLPKASKSPLSYSLSLPLRGIPKANTFGDGVKTHISSYLRSSPSFAFGDGTEGIPLFAFGDATEPKVCTDTNSPPFTLGESQKESKDSLAHLLYPSRRIAITFGGRTPKGSKPRGEGMLSGPSHRIASPKANEGIPSVPSPKANEGEERRRTKANESKERRRTKANTFGDALSLLSGTEGMGKLSPSMTGRDKAGKIKQLTPCIKSKDSEIKITFSPNLEARNLVFLKLYHSRIISKSKWLFSLPYPGKMRLFDGRTGQPFASWITVGYAYMLKLIHLVDNKMHSRSTGPYSLITRQPVTGKARQGGQRIGEMEAWALEGFGAAYTLQEFFSFKGDDVSSRHQWQITTMSKMVGNTTAFKTLLSELRALCISIDFTGYSKVLTK